MSHHDLALRELERAAEAAGPGDRVAALALADARHRANLLPTLAHGLMRTGCLGAEASADAGETSGPTEEQAGSAVELAAYCGHAAAQLALQPAWARNAMAPRPGHWLTLDGHQVRAPRMSLAEFVGGGRPEGWRGLARWPGALPRAAVVVCSLWARTLYRIGTETLAQAEQLIEAARRSLLCGCDAHGRAWNAAMPTEWGAIGLAMHLHRGRWLAAIQGCAHDLGEGPVREAICAALIPWALGRYEDQHRTLSTGYGSLVRMDRHPHEAARARYGTLADPLRDAAWLPYVERPGVLERYRGHPLEREVELVHHAWLAHDATGTWPERRELWEHYPPSPLDWERALHKRAPWRVVPPAQGARLPPLMIDPGDLAAYQEEYDRAEQDYLLSMSLPPTR